MDWTLNYMISTKWCDLKDLSPPKIMHYGRNYGRNGQQKSW